MSNTLSYIIQINSNFEKVNSSFTTFETNVHKGIGKIQKQLNSVNMNAMIQNISAAADGLTSMNDPGIRLSSSLADLSAITGQTGKGLKEIEGYARENAKTFGGSAADGVEAYKIILSKLTPEIAKQPKALQAMGNSVATLSKTMGGDTVAATEVLTTAMNQFQVSMTDPIRASKDMSTMMNIMAAAAKEGSAELPEIKSALEQAGLAAKTANVSFAETNAGIQVLDKAGKKGAEGGVALRNVMSTLAEGRFLPKEVITNLKSAGVDINNLGDRSKTLKERLEPLKKVMGDQALMTKLFGRENIAAAIALISGTDEMGRLTKVIQGTNTAYEQAAVVMDTPLEKNKRLQAQIDDFKISLFNSTNGWLGYANVLGNTTRDFSNLMPIFSGAGKVFSTITSATKLQALWTGIVSSATSVWTSVQAAFNVVMAMNPIVLIVLGVLALVAAIAWVVSMTEGWGKAWKHTMNAGKLIIAAFVEAVKLYFGLLVEPFLVAIDLIKVGWLELQDFLSADNSNAAAIAKINADADARQKALLESAKKVKDYTVQAGKEVILAATSVHFKKEDKKSDNKISEANIPGTDFGKGGAVGATSGASKVQKSNEAVATGGTKHNYFTITIHEVNGLKDVVVSAKDLAVKAGDEVADGLLRVITMATTATGS